ncbi:MAG TPA: acetyl-CoA carboxylase biotin carboxyl carrier protein [Roseiflexaceae bacterium]|nr:acetyl-CoA carboxylase biotin carboxyl carrier protein [Roseiflexaceae bacterium]HMP41250.1 acetyl-CoA carboxylase biotin carboxyl carrier protein [Roseiflexaceae bacterium]
MSQGATDQPPARADAELDLGAVRELLRMMVETDIAEIAFERGDFKLHVKRGSAQPLLVTPSLAAAMHTASAATSAGGYGTSHPPAVPAAVMSEPEPAIIGHSVNAPMVGTFYTSSSPKDAPFVNEGDVIQPGDCIGIIEAMKIMNEIASDIGGRVTRVMVKNGQPVEYGQPLVVIEPV